MKKSSITQLKNFTLQERCEIFWALDGVEIEKIKWLISRLTPEAISNNNLITDMQIKQARVELLWYGLDKALLNYIQIVKNY